LPSIKEKADAGAVKEWEWNYPTTMYGCNKLYCEHLGRYYSLYYRQLAADCGGQETVDFRAIRFPGLISAETTPTGGTSDFGPEMLHAAAKGEEYQCFVRPETTIPFMVMPDAIKSLVQLEHVPKNRLSQLVYNVTSFSISAQDIFNIVLEAFPNAKIHFAVDDCRQRIVDTWPENVDDSAARKDWDWEPEYDCDRSFHEYLIPAIRQRYQS
jgi:nucleoside-diphosphate-sugar epimerase